MSRSRHRYFESGFLAPREVRPSRPSIFRRSFAPREIELWPGLVITLYFDADAQMFWTSSEFGDFRDPSALAIVDSILCAYDSHSVAA